MSVNNPMSNFNRKNPYVIQAKQQYNILMDKYEDICKTLFINYVINILIYITVIIISIITKSYFNIILESMVLIAHILITYAFIKNTIKDDINSEIDHMVTIESNEIMNIDVTYVQDLLYTIHNRLGKTDAWHTCYKMMSCLYFMSSMIIAF